MNLVGKAKIILNTCDYNHILSTKLLIYAKYYLISLTLLPFFIDYS